MEPVKRKELLLTIQEKLIENKDIYKLSPFKELTLEQLDLKNKIIDVCEKHINDDKPFVYLVKGEAGSR